MAVPQLLGRTVHTRWRKPKWAGTRLGGADGNNLCGGAAGLRGAGAGMRLSVDAVALQVAIQTGAAYPEHLRRAEAVAVAHLQDFLDVQLADFVQGEWTPVLVVGEAGVAMLQVLGHIADVDEIAGGSDARGRDYVFQFTDVALPGMLEEEGLRATGKPGDALA